MQHPTPYTPQPTIINILAITKPKMRSFAPISMFSSTLILLWLLLVGISHAQSPSPSPSPADSDAPIEPSLPSYFYTQCESQYSLYTYNDSMVTTTAKMMDWCGCENKLNPQGLAYAGSKHTRTPDRNHAPGLDQRMENPRVSATKKLIIVNSVHL